MGESICDLAVERLLDSRDSPDYQLFTTKGDIELTSAVITPSHPVISKHLSTSSRYRMFPLAKTGIFNAFLTSLMTSQSARPVIWPFISLVRP